MSKDYYCILCKDCEYLYHCYGREVGERIVNNDVGDMYLHPDNCNNYYPEIKQ